MKIDNHLYLFIVFFSMSALLKITIYFVDNNLVSGGVYYMRAY